MSIRLNNDAATVAVYLAMLEDNFITQIKDSKYKKDGQKVSG
jgi:hypothetical protein